MMIYDDSHLTPKMTNLTPLSPNVSLISPISPTQLFANVVPLVVDFDIVVHDY